MTTAQKGMWNAQIPNVLLFMSSMLLFNCSKRRKVDKGGKGLRHFSMKVCEKVQKKGTTTYNEVADELVAEFTDPARCTSPADQVYRITNFVLARATIIS